MKWLAGYAHRIEIKPYKNTMPKMLSFRLSQIGEHYLFTWHNGITIMRIHTYTDDKNLYIYHPKKGAYIYYDKIKEKE